MHAQHLIDFLLFCSAFLIVTAGVLAIAKRFSFPYTALLLLTGFVAQGFLTVTGISSHVYVSTDIIYFLLLPLLLFESAVHMNFHQFRLQFKTVTFLATFGLLLSIATIAILVTYLAGLPFSVALLFGALISATDPIAVLAIFKNLGAPKRLSLLADGESMFNDATGVIAYKVVAAAVLAGNSLGAGETIQGVGSFLVVFVGSIGLGAVCAYLMSLFIAKIDNDRLVETTMTVALAIGSFVIAEHFFHFSGVITTVVAGIVLGNLGKTRISAGVHQFLEELWEYIGFIALSVVFFFSTFTLEIEHLFSRPLFFLLIVVCVFIGRAVSVYVSFWITNRSKLFFDEPNVPLAWQHVLTWGGLRGVIPLVLVYSIPDSYMYKGLLLQATLITFLCTLFINATTIDKLLIALGLHLPKKEEEIVNLEEEIFQLEEAKENLSKLHGDEFDSSVVHELKERILTQEKKLKEHLLDIATPAEFEVSLRLAAISIERSVVRGLYEGNHVGENVFFEFESELDLQQDALEHPEIVRKTRGVREDGTIDSSSSFSKRIFRAGSLFHNTPILGRFGKSGKERLILDRLALLYARMNASSQVIEYLERVKTLIGQHHHFHTIISSIRSEHENYRLRNHYQIQHLTREYPRIYRKFETPLVESFAWSKQHIVHES